MEQDKNMFDDKRQAKFQCRALNINEDLGRSSTCSSSYVGSGFNSWSRISLRVYNVRLTYFREKYIDAIINIKAVQICVA